MPRLTGTTADPIPTDQRPLVKVWLQKRNKYMTGFCNDGHCEGTKPKTRDGRGIKTCPLTETCPCKCHFELDQMFKMTGSDRISMSNPLYSPNLPDFNIEDYLIMGGDDVTPIPSIDDDTDSPRTVQTAPLMAPRRDPVVLSTRRTETGRAARGGLEAQVLEAVNKMFDADKDALPKEVADYIADTYKVPTPSTGAVGAVFNRWETLGFAVQAKKPVRLVDFAGEYQGTWNEVERLKAKAKLSKKHTQQAARNGHRK